MNESGAARANNCPVPLGRVNGHSKQCESCPISDAECHLAHNRFQDW